MLAVGMIDIGRVRKRNEDSILVSNTQIGSLPNVYAVADGMGGHNAGSVASELAIQEFCNYLKSHEGASITKDEDILLLMKSGILHANYMVHSYATENEDLQGMGTTLSACSLVGNKLYIAHVGDTRIYLISRNDMRQVTTDHSYVQEMLSKGYISSSEVKEHPQRHMITRAVGTYEKVKVDTLVYPIEEIEYVLLCSDGLTSMLSDEEIYEIVYSREGALEEIVMQLIERANNKGGKDNIAVVIGMNKEVMK